MNPLPMVIAVMLAAPAPEATLARAAIRQAEVECARGDESAAAAHLRDALETAKAAGAVAEQAAAAVGLMELSRSAVDRVRAEPLVAHALALAPRGTLAEAEALRSLAAVHVAVGQIAAAETSLRQALEVAQQAPGMELELRAAVLGDLGLLLVGVGRVPEAEEVLRRGLAIDEAGEKGRPHVVRRARLVSTLDLLASLAAARGNPAEGEPLLRRAVALATLEPRLAPADVAAVTNGLARVLVEGGDTREAGRLAGRALELYERVHGPRHAEVAETLVTLAAVRAAEGDVDQAQALLRRAARVADLEQARPVVKAAAAANLGGLWLVEGRYQDAEPQLERALELAEGAVGVGHPGLLRIIQRLADCYRLRDRAPEAGALYARALDLATRAYGRRSAAAVPSLSGLAMVEERSGNAAAGEALHREALAIAEETSDPHDPARAEALVALAGFYQRRGESGPAEHLYMRAMAAVERTDARDPRRLAVVSGLASLYAGQGRRAEASRLQRALSTRGALPGAAAWVVPPADQP